MSWLLLRNQIGEHRAETVDRICCLAFAASEVLDGQGVESPVRH